MTELPLAKTRPASNWSAIWVLPLLALAIGAWLAWRAYSEAGIEIRVLFDNGAGIQAGKTEVIFKGIAIGKVTELTLDRSGQRRGVIATLEMNKDAEPHLLSGTRFWLVKPSVSLAGITGLETLVSGNYIAVSPGEGEPTRDEQRALYGELTGRDVSDTTWSEIFAAARYTAIVVRVMNRSVARGDLPADQTIWLENPATVCLQQLFEEHGL